MYGLVKRAWAESVDRCRMASGLAAEVGCLDQGVYSLRAGVTTVPVRVAVDPRLRAGSMVFARETLDRLALPVNLPTSITRQGDELRLGPVVGVLVNPRVTQRLAEGRANFRIRQLGEANRHVKCILYVFCPEDVDLVTRLVSGYRYDFEAERWKKGSFPLPDVVYDRGGGFRASERPLARQVRNQLRCIEGLQFFNAQHYFSKWDLHLKLSQHLDLLPHLPETVLYRSQDDLDRMLKRHRSVFIKSLTGSNGFDVMRVIARDGQFQYDWMEERIRRGTCSSLTDLVRVTRRFLGRQLAIVQQGIEVLKLGPSSVDMRALVQRGATGEWQLVDLPVRIGVEGAAVTSTRTGSKVCSLEDCFQGRFGFSTTEVAALRERLVGLVMAAVQAIEAEYGRFGELGVDVAMDVGGRVWFIEANSKPAKDTIRLSGKETVLNTSFVQPLQYCQFLSGFAKKEAPPREVRITVDAPSKCN